MTTISTLAFEHWNAGTPIHDAHPNEERRAGDETLVPLYIGSSIANVLTVNPDGSESTFSGMVQPPGRGSPTRRIAKVGDSVAVAGRPRDHGAAIPGAIAGEERDYAGGRLTGASQVLLTVGWSSAARLFEKTGIPAVATMRGPLLGQGLSEGENLINVALKLRDSFPAETTITIAVTDDRTSKTKNDKRIADIQAEQAEAYAREVEESQNSKAWKRQEAREEAERLRTQAQSITLFDAASHAAKQIKARLVALDGNGV